MPEFKMKMALALMAAVFAMTSPAALQAQEAASANDKSEDRQLETVVVLGNKNDGSAEDGYVVKEVENFGPWGSKAVLDTPYTVFAVKAPFIANIQAQSPSDVLKVVPNVYGSGQSDLAATMNLSTRGLWTQRNVVNGVPTDNAGMGIFVEDVESMEVLSGLSGFMYGQGNVGGLISYNLKRPTYEFYNKIKVGNYGGDRLYAHVDLGGPIVSDTLAFRFNAMGQDGDTSVDGQSIRKKFVSGAVDWNITDDLQVQFNASYGKSEVDGRQASFTIPDVTGATWAVLPSAPDPSKLWAPEETGVETTGTMFNAGLKYRINDSLNFRAAVSHQEVERQMAWAAGGFTSALGDFRYTPAYADWLYKSNGAYAYLDADFDTFGINHKLTVGANGYRQETILGRFSNTPGGTTYTNAGTRPLQFADLNFHRPLHMPSYSSVHSLLFNKRTKLSETFNYNLVIGDEITFNDQWTLMAGLNYANINVKTFNNLTNEQLASDYGKSKLTPSLALLYKPTNWITTYASYNEALENGTVVGATYQNAGEYLPPLMSEQYEVGVKAEVGKMLLTAALFQINKGLQYGLNGRFVQDGRQRYQGLELTGSGKLLDSLTLMGGVTFIDAEVVKTNTPAYAGKRPQYAPKTIAKLYAEYDLPFLDGLTLTGGINHFGTVMANQLNTVELPAYTVGDIGLRYITDLKGVETTFRLNATNITNKAYWVGNSGSAVYLGEPRNVSFTAEFSF